MLRRLIIFFGLVGAFLSGAAASASDKIEIHYIPFGSETYHSITMEGIVKAANYSIEVAPNDERMLELGSILENASSGPPLNESFVRARIRFPGGRTVFIDKTGGVRLPERDATLGETARARVITLIVAFTEARLSESYDPRAGDLAEAYLVDWQARTGQKLNRRLSSAGVDEESGLYILRIFGRIGQPWIDFYVDPETKALVREVVHP